MPFDAAGSSIEPTVSNSSLKSSRETARRFRHACLFRDYKYRRRLFGFLRSAPTVLDIVQNAQALIAHPDDWCQGVFAMKSGRLCSLGALCVASYRAGYSMRDETYQHAVDALSEHLSPVGDTLPLGVCVIAAFNDEYDHAAVMRAFDSTRASLQQAN